MLPENKPECDNISHLTGGGGLSSSEGKRGCTGTGWGGYTRAHCGWLRACRVSQSKKIKKLHKGDG